MTVAGCATATTAPAPLAPPITLDQLDAARYADRPCDLLTPERLAQLRLAAPGAVEHTADGTVCGWTAQAPAHTSLSAGVDRKRTLEDLYRRRPEFATFGPIDIAGYPAVNTTGGGQAAPGACTAHVAVADTATVTVTADEAGTGQPGSADPCPEADKIATAIVGQLEAGSP
nr:DUF3558 domain-containing protein [Pseudonocardia acidicola]